MVAIRFTHFVSTGKGNKRTPIFIDPRRIVAVETDGSDGCLVYVESRKHPYRVNESADAVVSSIGWTPVAVRTDLEVQ